MKRKKRKEIVWKGKGRKGKGKRKKEKKRKGKERKGKQRGWKIFKKNVSRRSGGGKACRKSNDPRPIKLPTNFQSCQFSQWNQLNQWNPRLPQLSSLSFNLFILCEKFPCLKNRNSFENSKRSFRHSFLFQPFLPLPYHFSLASISSRRHEIDYKKA